jgi:asparagine synthase (glutamine-hydrolysing)
MRREIAFEIRSMCGIYASIGYAPDEDRIDCVAHRGPDGRGWKQFTSPAGLVALGHRRLAIIDVSNAGLQPMADPSGRYQLVYNGELYNYLELREELEARGEIFLTETDTEVLLRAYMLWGEAVLDRFRGMFAFIIWDELNKRLFAARDRFGIKPLYLIATAHGVAFASEIKQLLQLPGLPGRMNLARVYDFLASGISDHTAETMFDGVMQLRGGECAVVDASREGPLEVQVRRWYAILDASRSLTLSEHEAANQFRELLMDSVRIHLRSDVALGSCLSGGLDSSSLVCLMAAMLGSSRGGAKVNTVSACYTEPSVDETPFMDAVVRHTCAQSHYVFPRAEDIFARASDITWHQDEPFGSSSIFAQWCVFAEARRAGIKVMLDGQGADEQLAGYHSSFSYYLSSLARQGRWLMLVSTIAARSRRHGVSVGEQLQRLLVPLFSPWLAAILRRQRRSLAQHNWLESSVLHPFARQPTAFEVAHEVLGLPRAFDIATLCVTLTFASNLQMLLHWEDRNSMAHSVEARVPFVDHRLVEFSLMLGNDHKIVGADTKRVLRGAMSGILPDVILNRQDKLGFATPEEAWFRGPLRHLTHEAIQATLTRYPYLFNVDGTKRLVADMLNGIRPVDFTLWRIVNLGIWGERFGVSI